MQSDTFTKSNVQNQRRFNRRTFIRYAGACTAVGFLTGACKQSALDPSPVAPVPSTNPTSPAISNNSIACYGDSLTDGIGGTKMSILLTSAFPDRLIENYGISGQNALEIATRQGGQPLLVTLENNAFAGSTPVTLTKLSAKVLFTPDSDDTSTLSGSIGGIPCVLTRMATGIAPNQVETYTLSPLLPTNQAIPANSQLLLDSARKTKSYIQTLWIGRNNLPNLTGVTDLINSCILYLDNPRRFVVIGILSAVNERQSVNDTILETNATLAKTYPDNFVASTPPTTSEMAALNYEPTDTDLADIAAGFIPSGMRLDGLHMTTVGYQLIANRITNRIKLNGW